MGSTDNASVYGCWGAARSGALATQAGIEAQVERMLSSGKARSAMGNFHLQLLGVGGHGVPNKSSAVYPDFNEAAWHAMVDDTVRFADHVVRRGDGKLSTLLTGAYMVNAQDEVVQLDRIIGRR